ncbi:HNH endonuclease signature motif containing protein [soil metagenome]
MITVADFAEQIVLSPAELLAALAEHEQRAAVLALAARRVHVAGEWAFDGSVSMAAWLRHNGRMSNRTASNLVRRGRFLDKFAAIADAAVSRALSAGQVDAIAAVCQPKYEPMLADHQQMLVAALAPLEVSDAELACQVWRQKADAIIDADAPPAKPKRELSFQRADDRALLGRFTLDDAAATEFEKAIRNAVTYENGDARTRPQVQGDAIFDIAAFYNKNHTRTGTPRNLPHVSLSVAASTLNADLPQAVNDDDQQLIDATCTDTYLCDCFLHVIVRGAGGLPLSFGRARYVVPRKLFRQVAARDGGCRFPGCNRNVRYCDAHHIRWWRHNGATDYDNLVLLCNRHHHVVHKQRLDVKLLPSGQLDVTWHTGEQRSSQPRGAPPSSGG